MSTSVSKRMATAIAAGAFALVLSAFADSAVAAERGARARASQPRPNAAVTRSTTVQRTETGRTSHTTVTGANGKTATRDVVVTRDPTAGTVTRDADYTGPNGKTRSAENVTQRTDDGFTRNTTITNANGQTATTQVIVSKDVDAGTRTRSVDRTGFDGKTLSVDSVTQRTDDGFTRNTTTVGPDGTVSTRTVDVSCDQARQNCTRTVDANGGAGGN